MRAGEDTVVNRKLYFAGKRTYFCATTSFAHATPSSGLAHLLRHHFQRGRALGRIIRTDSTKSRRALLRSTKSLPKRRLRHIAASLDGAGEELRGRYRGLVRAYTAAGALAAATGTWYQLLVGATTTRAAGCPLTPAATGPLLAISGRPGEAATGLLAAGSAKQTAGRLRTLARYANSVCAVRPALAPIVTSAMVTSENAGTHTVDLPRSIVDTYLRAARDAGALFLLQVQPGSASLATIVDRWADLLGDADVGVLFDLRRDVAFANQGDELAEAVRLAREVGGEGTVIAVRGVDAAPPGTIVVPGVFDLRRPGTPYPHDALASDPRLEALVYE
jgi:hypothetical protein